MKGQETLISIIKIDTLIQIFQHDETVFNCHKQLLILTVSIDVSKYLF